MSATTKGFLGLAFWLIVGFRFTELTSLALNAWVLHGAAAHAVGTVAPLQPEPAHN